MEPPCAGLSGGNEERHRPSSFVLALEFLLLTLQPLRTHRSKRLARMAEDDQHLLHRLDETSLERSRDRELKEAFCLSAGRFLRVLPMLELLLQRVDLFEEGGDALDEPMAGCSGHVVPKRHVVSAMIGTSPATMRSSIQGGRWRHHGASAVTCRAFRI